MFSRSLIDSDTQLNQTSYYEASVQRPPVGAPLDGPTTADVLVVGGGFAGLSAALELAQRGPLGGGARSRPRRLGRERAQRRPGDRRLRQRPGGRSRRSWARPTRSAPGRCRSRQWT